MTPINYSSSNAYNLGVSSTGSITSSIVRTSYAIRPVISIKPNVLVSGSGTSSNPYVVTGI